MAPSTNLLFKILFLLVIQSVFSKDEDVANPELPKHFKKIFTKATNKCAEKLNVTPINLFQTFVNEGPFSLLVNENSKCYLLCVFQEFSMMDSAGNFKEASIRALLNSMPNCRFMEAVKLHLDTCLKEDDQQPCEKAYKFAKCFSELAAIRNLGPVAESQSVLPASDVSRLVIDN